MSATFTRSNAIDMQKERDWAANLGMLDWDGTQIVFTKRSLLEFLKYAGVTVDPNFTNIQKLPRYAQFALAEVSEVAAQGDAADAGQPGQQSVNVYRPSRRVRTAPGGGHTDIFGNDSYDALSNAPPRPSQSNVSMVPSTVSTTTNNSTASPDETVANDQPRNKRNASSGITGLWDEPKPDEFKPTRRVREMPGGKDSISSLF